MTSQIERVVAAEDGTGLHVEVDGADRAGPVFVFVNGLNLTIHHWRSQRTGLAGAGRLVFYDHRGHGRSGRATWRTATLRQSALDLKAVLEATAPGEPVVLVAHSMGATAVTALASECPELFGDSVAGVALLEALPGRWGDVSYGLGIRLARPLVALATLLAPFQSVSAFMFWLVNRATVLVRPSLAPTAPQRRAAGRARGRNTVWGGVVMSASTLTFTALVTDSMVKDYSAALPTVGRAAALVVAGTGDPYIPDRAKTRLAELIPGARLLLVENGGHSSHRRQADLVNAELMELAARAALPRQLQDAAQRNRGAGGEPTAS
ncbi:alpha/beta fold hydrolase [Streptomyces sp. NPDC002533]